MAVGDVQPPRGIERREVRDQEPSTGRPFAETIDATARDLESEDRGVLHVADEQVPGAVERHPEAEPAGRSHLLDRGSVGIDAEDLPPLPAAPHTSVGCDGHALGVIELRIAERAVEEHAHPIVCQQHADVSLSGPWCGATYADGAAVRLSTSASDTNILR
jgi:hypothetical protein